MKQTSHKIRIAVIVALAAYAIILLLTGTVAPDKEVELLKGIGAPVAVGGFAAGLVSKLGRYKWYRWLTGVPDFSGRWEGWFQSEIKADWQPVAVEFTQDDIRLTANEVTVVGGQTGTSWSYTVAVLNDANEADYKLIWTYQAVNPNSKIGGNHWGTYFVRLTRHGKEKRLEGRYVDDRPRPGVSFEIEGVSVASEGVAGDIVYQKTKKPLTGALDFNEATWAISKNELPKRDSQLASAAVNPQI